MLSSRSFQIFDASKGKTVECKVFLARVIVAGILEVIADRPR